MIYNSTDFKFNNEWLSSKINALNITLENNMYTESITGSRTLIEEKISGRSEPYLYGLESSPLQFNITIGLEKPSTIGEIRSLLRWLFEPVTYSELIFKSDLTKLYYVLFIGEPKFIYIETKDAKLIGYITLTVRCNSDTAFTAAQQLEFPKEKDFINDQPINVFNEGDETCYTNLKIIFNSDTFAIDDTEQKILITNTSNGTNIEFTGVENDEEINVDMSTKIITSTIQLTDPIYPRWNKNYLSLRIGGNNIEITITAKNAAQQIVTKSDAVIFFDYQAKRYL